MQSILYSEILQQPKVLQRLLHREWDQVKRVASELKKNEIKFIFLTARGTSDNAGLYAKYLLGLHNGLPIALAAPSLFSIYHQPPALRGCAVLGISQSGESPDIVAVLQEARVQGVPTISITNASNSPLAQLSDMVIDIGAGEEKAIAATKSYTGQLMAIAMLSAALAESEDRHQELVSLSSRIEDVLQIEAEIEDAAAQFVDITHGVVLGRGYNYATAYEWSLKMKELAYVVAEPYSSADFLHGPIALVDDGFPVFALVQTGSMFDEMSSLVERLKFRHGARTIVVTNEAECFDYSDVILPTPSDVPEHLSPIVSIVPAQLFSYHLACKKGLDPESPRGLTKVTQTT